MKFTPVGLWRIYLGLVICSGIYPLARYFSGIPVAAGGISSFRWVVICGVAFIQLICGWLLLRTWINPGRSEAQLGSLFDRTSSVRSKATVYLLGLLFLLLCIYVILLAPEIGEIYSRLIFMRLEPLAMWAAFVIAISLLGFGLLHGSSPFRFSFHASFWLVLGLFILSMLAWAFLARPFIPELVNRAGWNAAGVPVVEWQLAIAWLGGLALVGLVALIDRWITRKSRPLKFNPKWLDFGIAAVLWLLSVQVWQSIEITPSWFVSSRLPPNRELYPLSDARLYDTVAQDALDGAGLRFSRSPYIRRPLHGLFLLVMHLVAGQDYEKLVFTQILVLAFLPVLMYFLVKSFHNRISAAFAALILILREANSIALAGTITAAHVKVLLVDLLTALMVILVAYVAFHWFKSVSDTRINGLGVGGCLGLAMLVRLETSVFIPALILILVLILLPGKLVRPLVIQTITFLVGIALVISPWVVRNWLKTGEIFIDSPSHRQSLILQRFTLWEDSTPVALPKVTQPISPAPGEISPTGIPYAAPQLTQAVPVEVPQIGELTLDPQSLRGLAAYFMAHYLNSQVQTIIYLPSAFRGLDSLVSLSGHRSLERFLASCCSLKEYVQRLPFWHRWEGEFPRQSLLLIGMNIIAIAFGISLMWQRHSWNGLVPVVMWFFYLVVHAIFRNSGGRYILPVDWISILYFSIGLAHFSVYLYRLYFKRESWKEDTSLVKAGGGPSTCPPASSKFISYPLIVVCLMVSLSIPFVEYIFPESFIPGQENQMLAEVLKSPDLTEQQRKEIMGALQSGSVAEVGRALYPQFFRAGYGAPGYEQGPLSARDYPRLVFFLTGENSSDLALPVREKVRPIPDGSSALVVLCPAGFPDFPEVLAAAFFDPSGQLDRVFYRSTAAEEYACPSITTP